MQDGAPPTPDRTAGPHEPLWASTLPLTELTIGPVCGVEATVPDPVRRHLLHWPAGVHEPRPWASCELAPQHDGSHHALGQAADLGEGTSGHELWVTWSRSPTGGDTRPMEVVQAAPCGERSAGELALCLLLDRHADSHGGVLPWPDDSTRLDDLIPPTSARVWW